MNSNPAKPGLSLATRLTLTFALVATLALGLLGGVTLLTLNLYFEAHDRDILHAHLQRARQLLERVDNTGALATLPQQLHATFAMQKDLSVRVHGAYAQLLYEQHGEAHMPSVLIDKPASAPPVPLLTWRTGHTVWRGSAVMMPLPMPGAAPLTVAMALDVDHHEAFVASFRWALIGYVVLAAAACALVGGWAVRRGLRNP